jgi:hypothetical protein
MGSSAAEQAQPRGDGVKGLRGVIEIEDVVVLIEWRAVADLQRVGDEHGSGRQLGQESPMRAGQHGGRPVGRGARRLVEFNRRLEACADLVVIPADHRHRVERDGAIDRFDGIGAVPDQIAEHEHLIVAARGRVLEHRVKGLQVGVNVGENEVAHGRQVVVAERSKNGGSS